MTIFSFLSENFPTVKNLATVLKRATLHLCRNLPGVKSSCAYGWEPYRHLFVDCLEKMWVPRRLTALWAFTACYRNSVTFYVTLHLWLYHIVRPPLFSFLSFPEFWQGQEYFPRRPDTLWGPPSLLSNGPMVTRGFSPGGKAAGAWSWPITTN
jgi:hypothetical protein